MPVRGMNIIGVKEDFDPQTMRSLYGDHATYLRRFTDRLDELIAEGWLLSMHRDVMLAQARDNERLFA